jgi:hypothetical protein
VGKSKEYTGNNFLNGVPIAQQLRERIDRWGYMKPKIFCTTKEMMNRMKEKKYL